MAQFSVKIISLTGSVLGENQQLTILEDRKLDLAAQLLEPQEAPLALHPGMADVYRRKVAELTTALNDDSTKTEAAELLRGLLSGIRLVPEGDGLAIELAGELASIMALGEADIKKPRRVASGAGALTLVAGTGFEPVTFRL